MLALTFFLVSVVSAVGYLIHGWVTRSRTVRQVGGRFPWYLGFPLLGWAAALGLVVTSGPVWVTVLAVLAYSSWLILLIHDIILYRQARRTVESFDKFNESMTALLAAAKAADNAPAPKPFTEFDW